MEGNSARTSDDFVRSTIGETFLDIQRSFLTYNTVGPRTSRKHLPVLRPICVYNELTKTTV